MILFLRSGRPYQQFPTGQRNTRPQEEGSTSTTSSFFRDRRLESGMAKLQSKRCLIFALLFLSLYVIYLYSNGDGDFFYFYFGFYEEPKFINTVEGKTKGSRTPVELKLFPNSSKVFEGRRADDPNLIQYIKKHKIFPPAKGPYHLEYENKVDHSQFGQTMVLRKLLHDMKGGFFVEVGAFDGETFSNTLHFERFLDWTGLLIEPDLNNFSNKLLSKGRKAFSVQACLSLTNVSAYAFFREAEATGRLTSRHRGKKLQCFPLYSLLLALDTTHIDLLTLDIEGDEVKVLKTIPWDIVSITMLMVEINHVPEGKEAVKTYMESKGYELLTEHKIDYIFGRPDLLAKIGGG